MTFKKFRPKNRCGRNRFRPKCRYFRFTVRPLVLVIPDEDDLVLWTEAEVAVSAAAELLKREERRVSRFPSEEAPAEAPPAEALAPPTKLLGVAPEPRLLLVPQES